MAVGSLLFVLCATALCIIFPKLAKVAVLFACLPFLGFIVGGFVWAIAALFVRELASFQSFVAFAVLGTLAVFVVFMKMK